MSALQGLLRSQDLQALVYHDRHASRKGSQGGDRSLSAQVELLTASVNASHHGLHCTAHHALHYTPLHTTALHCMLCTALHTRHRHCSPCPIHHALYTMHCTPCPIHHALLTMPYTPCTAHHALYTMHCTPCTARRCTFPEAASSLCMASTHPQTAPRLSSTTSMNAPL